MTVQKIDEILKLISPVIIKSQNSTIEFPVEFTFFHVLERVEMNLNSIQALLKDGLEKNNHAIGLLSRNLISDFITTGYIVRQSNSNEELYANLYSLYNTDLKRSDTFLEMYKKFDMVNDSIYEEYNAKYSDNNNIYKEIRDYQIKFNTPDFPTVTSIIKLFLKLNLFDYWSIQIMNSYPLWMALSKYQHVGWNSYEKSREINHVDSIKRLNTVLHNTSIMTASCLDLLNKKDEMEIVLEMIKNDKKNNFI